MLLGNYAQVNRNTARDLGGAFSNPHATFKATVLPAFYVGEHVVPGQTDRSGFPNGYLPPYSWRLPLKAGGMSTSGAVRGAGAMTGAAAGGKNAQASLSGSGDLQAIGQLIVSMVASLAGAGGVSAADLRAYLQLAASLSGSGGASAQLRGIGHASAAIGGSGTAAATIRAVGALLAQITVTGAGLNTGNVGQAVWGAIASAFNEPGTMGNKLNSASAAGDPWTADLPGSYAPGSAGEIVGNLPALLAALPADVWDEIVEAAVTAREAMRLAAAGVGGSTVDMDTGTGRVKSLDGSKDRVVATLDGDGNRTVVSRDLS